MALFPDWLLIVMGVFLGVTLICLCLSYLEKRGIIQKGPVALSRVISRILRRFIHDLIEVLATEPNSDATVPPGDVRDSSVINPVRELRERPYRAEEGSISSCEQSGTEIARAPPLFPVIDCSEIELEERLKAVRREVEERLLPSDVAGAAARVEVIDFGELKLEERPMAAGSFKTVYRAMWVRPGQSEGKVVAVLVVRSMGSIIRSSMALEVAVFERLGIHPHLCTLLATTVRPDKGDQCMVMEYAQMGSLDVVLQDLSESGADQPTNAVLLTVAGQVCDAMQQLGLHDIIHRDLAARNCLVFGFHPKMRRHVLVKVTDYGLAVASGPASRSVTTVSGCAAGPMRWMAPESIRTRRYSKKSDVYSFGILLWEIWSRCEIPFAVVADDEEVARRVMDGARPGRPSGCPDAVFAMMQSCWNQDSRQRPSFAQLKFDIQDAFVAVARDGHVDPKDEDEDLCVICLGRAATHALIPCGHLCVCEQDVVLIDRCPVCRAAVQNRQRIW